MRTFLLLCMTWLTLSTSALATTSSTTPLPVEVYLSSTCPNCRLANHFFTQYALTHPELALHLHWIDQDRAALQQFKQQLTAVGESDFTVPSFFFCQTRWVGFSAALETPLLHNIQYCVHQLAKHTPPQQIAATLNQNSQQIYYFHLLQTLTTHSIPLLLAIAVIDTLHTPSLFSALLFFACVLLQPTARKRFWMGVISLSAYTLTHLTALLAPYTLLQLLALPALSTLLGLSLLLFPLAAFQICRIPFSLLLCINFFSSLWVAAYQQIPTPNFILLLHPWQAFSPPFSTLTHIVLLCLYFSVYLLPAGCCLYLLSQRPPSNSLQGRWFQSLLLLSIGFILSIKASQLTSFTLSIICCLMSLLIGKMISHVFKKELIA